MTVYSEWDDAGQTVLRITFHGEWTWDELYTASQQAKTMLEEVQHPLGVVMDLTGATLGLPRRTMANMRSLVIQSPAPIRLVVFAGKEDIVRKVRNTFVYLYSGVISSKYIVSASSLEDARRQIYGQLQSNGR